MRNLFIDEVDEFMQTVFEDIVNEINNSFLEEEEELKEEEEENDLNLLRFFDEITQGKRRPAELDKLIDDNPLVYDRVIFNDSATIVLWADGTKTIVKACKGDKFDKGVGLKTALLQRVFGKNIDKQINAIVDEDNKREKENKEGK